MLYEGTYCVYYTALLRLPGGDYFSYKRECPAPGCRGVLPLYRVASDSFVLSRYDICVLAGHSVYYADFAAPDGDRWHEAQNHALWLAAGPPQRLMVEEEASVPVQDRSTSPRATSISGRSLPPAATAAPDDRWTTPWPAWLADEERIPPPAYDIGSRAPLAGTGPAPPERMTMLDSFYLGLNLGPYVLDVPQAAPEPPQEPPPPRASRFKKILQRKK